MPAQEQDALAAAQVGGDETALLRDVLDVDGDLPRRASFSSPCAGRQFLQKTDERFREARQTDDISRRPVRPPRAGAPLHAPGKVHNGHKACFSNSPVVRWKPAQMTEGVKSEVAVRLLDKDAWSQQYVRLRIVRVVVAALAAMAMGACGPEGNECDLEPSAIGNWEGKAVVFGPVAGTTNVQLSVRGDHSAIITAHMTLVGYPLQYVYDCTNLCGDHGPPYRIRGSCEGSSAARGNKGALCANLGGDGKLNVWLYEKMDTCPDSVTGSGFMGALTRR